MKHHLFALFCAAIVASIVIGVGSSYLIAAHAWAWPIQADASSTVATPDFEVPNTEIPLDGSTSTLIEAATGSVSLIAPPVAHLVAISGNPKLQPGDIPVRVPVLMYHHIRPIQPKFTAKDRMFTVSPSAFEAQMIGLVRAGYHTITPDQLAYALEHGTSTLPSKPVLLTFDDGLKDQYTNAYPVLKRLHLQATFFIISQAFHLGGYMKPDMIKDMDQSGLITIASHTQRHPFLTHLSRDQQLKEIDGSKTDLETLLGHVITVFAYPYGDENAAVLKEVKDAGYTLGFWVQAGSLHLNSNRYKLHRIRVLDRENVVSLLDGFSATTANR